MMIVVTQKISQTLINPVTSEYCVTHILIHSLFSDLQCIGKKGCMCVGVYVCEEGVGMDSDKIVRLHYSLPAGGTQNNKVGLEPRGRTKKPQKKYHPRIIPLRHQPVIPLDVTEERDAVNLSNQ